MFWNSATCLIFLSSSWLFWGLSVVVDSSLIVGEPRVLRMSPSIYNTPCWLTLTMKTLKQEKYFCNILVYHVRCLSGPSAFSCLPYNNCVPVLLQHFVGFCPLSGWSRALLLTVSKLELWKWHQKDFSLAFHLFSGGYSESIRSCSGSPVTWKLYANCSLNLPQPFPLIGTRMDRKPFSFLTPSYASVCAALILGHHPVTAWSCACCD